MKLLITENKILKENLFKIHLKKKRKLKTVKKVKNEK